MREELRNDVDREQAILGGTVTLTAGFSVGYIVWLARSGVLISAAMSALPAWRFMDPLPILAHGGKRQDDDEDEESLESMVAEADSIEDQTGDTPEHKPGQTDKRTTKI